MKCRVHKTRFAAPGAGKLSCWLTDTLSETLWLGKDGAVPFQTECRSHSPLCFGVEAKPHARITCRLAKLSAQP